MATALLNVVEIVLADRGFAVRNHEIGGLIGRFQETAAMLRVWVMSPWYEKSPRAMVSKNP